MTSFDSIKMTSSWFVTLLLLRCYKVLCTAFNSPVKIVTGSTGVKIKKVGAGLLDSG